MPSNNIPFNKPFLTGFEIENISTSLKSDHLAGDGPFTKYCSEWLEKETGSLKVLLTNSCTAALEMCAILADIKDGDEIIMPSYTFVSSANAFVLRGGIPVFVDIRDDTMNIDEKLIEASITEKTKAILVMHYGGVSCEMDFIMNLADRYNLIVIEDAAQAILSSYKGKALGSIGHLGCFSFHETKNITCGEGGALLINEERYIKIAEIIREKGTNRSEFFRGQVDKYTWVNIGSSFLPSEPTAAFLWAQLSNSKEIIKKRISLWNIYHKELKELEDLGIIIRPKTPSYSIHNAHIYYIICKSLSHRSELIKKLKEKGIISTFHYIPLHNSVAGKIYGRTTNSLPKTVDYSDRLLRLPLWVGMDIEKIIDELKTILLNPSKM